MNRSTSSGNGELQVVLLLLLPQDGDPVLQVGLADVGHHAPLEAADQAGLEARDLLGRPVRGQDDLLVAFVERVKRMEELFLRHFLAFEEMHVVHQEEVHVGRGSGAGTRASSGCGCSR